LGIVISKRVAGMATLGGGTLGVLYGIDPNSFLTHLSLVSQNQIAQAGFAFTVAAWIHSGRVKQEIKLNFTCLTDALNNLADALRKELKEHSEQLASLRQDVQELQTQVKQGDKP
jgi:hypothetical protein